MVVIDIFAISTNKGTITATDTNNKQNNAEYSNIVYDNLVILINNIVVIHTDLLMNVTTNIAINIIAIKIPKNTKSNSGSLLSLFIVIYL